MAKFLETVEEFDSLIAGDKPVLVDFFATWCGPCKMLMPQVDKFASDYSQVDVIKVDIDQFKDIAVRYGITSVPTLKLFKGAEVVSSSSGYKPSTEIAKFVGAHVDEVN
jgi:thioredoxin 1